MEQSEVVYKDRGKRCDVNDKCMYEQRVLGLIWSQSFFVIITCFPKKGKPCTHLIRFCNIDAKYHHHLNAWNPN